MKPIQFKDQTRILQGRSDVASLPIWSNGSVCVSCWRPTLRERLSMFLFGRVWVSVISGNNQPPVAISAMRTFFKPANWRCEAPTEPGWYQVRWSAQDIPVVILVESIVNDCIVWRWDKDSELDTVPTDKLQEWGTLWLKL